jgi:thiamine kinase-like enzyme
MKRRLIEDGSEKHAYQLEVIDLIEKTFLFEGYQEHFSKQVPRDSVFPIVLAHNDAQENNIMMINGENEKIVMIDFEYGGWNPFSFDIANYISELSLDNAHPKGNGCKVYPSNFPSKQEIGMLCMSFLRQYWLKYEESRQVKLELGSADQENFETYWK